MGLDSRCVVLQDQVQVDDVVLADVVWVFENRVQGFLDLDVGSVHSVFARVGDADHSDSEFPCFVWKYKRNLPVFKSFWA